MDLAVLYIYRSRSIMNVGRQLVFFLFCFAFISCNGWYDSDYYEKASGVKIPASAYIIESFDNGEYCTVSSFELEPDDIRSLIKKYSFTRVEENYVPTIWCAGSLNKTRPDPGSCRDYMYFMRDNNKLHIAYLIDTVKHVLWASVSYPDWGW